MKESEKKKCDWVTPERKDHKRLESFGSAYEKTNYFFFLGKYSNVAMCINQKQTSVSPRLSLVVLWAVKPARVLYMTAVGLWANDN